MAFDRDELTELVHHPQESLAVELKQWIDPKQPEGKAKIARACMALRNNNGGCLVIGIQNDGQPDPNAPGNVQRVFHLDVIQGIIGKFSSQQFRVSVEFIERDGQDYPVIVVPSGVETPVAAKSDLASPTDSRDFLVKCDAVYVRTLEANNSVSSSAARWKDWAKLTRTCFDNREADIGAFIRRHLSNLKAVQLHELLAAPKPSLTSGQIAGDFLNEGKQRFEIAKATHKVSDEQK